MVVAGGLVGLADQGLAYENAMKNGWQVSRSQTNI